MYTGQAGPVYIELKTNSGACDREVLHALNEFAPTFSRGGDMAMDVLAGAPAKARQLMGRAADEDAQGRTKGFEVGNELFAINGRVLGHGQPIRVKHGERVLFQVVNASATEIRSLAQPGHGFRVVAVDGNPVPTPSTVPVLWPGTAERVSAIVTMRHPGVCVMGDFADDDRGHGMGIVVECAVQRGIPRSAKPKPFRWEYAPFGTAYAAPLSPDGTIGKTIVKHHAALQGFNRWTRNGAAFSMQSMKPVYTPRQGWRYRLRFRNASDDIHPRHRHSIEMTRIGGKPTAGVFKDVILPGGFRAVEIDFMADNPGLTLFHRRQPLHMDFGFMALFEYA
jgi:FtsP/CotA-like multicopper oxidase with cupredoxin domain